MKKSYAPEEKQALIDRYLSNKEPVGKLLASAGVPRSTFYGWLQTPLKERLAFAEQIYGKYNIHMICEALAIDRGTFYNHVLRNKRDNAWYAKRREELRLRVREVYDENKEVFGVQQITAILRKEGLRVSEKMVNIRH